MPATEATPSQINHLANDLLQIPVKSVSKSTLEQPQQTPQLDGDVAATQAEEGVEEMVEAGLKGVAEPEAELVDLSTPTTHT